MTRSTQDSGYALRAGARDRAATKLVCSALALALAAVIIRIIAVWA